MQPPVLLKAKDTVGIWLNCALTHLLSTIPVVNIPGGTAEHKQNLQVSTDCREGLQEPLKTTCIAFVMSCRQAEGDRYNAAFKTGPVHGLNLPVHDEDTIDPRDLYMQSWRRMICQESHIQAAG